MSMQLVTRSNIGIFKFSPEPLLTTRVGVPVDNMLEQASCLMDCIDKLTVVVQDDLVSDKEVVLFTIGYLNEIAKAMIDASLMAELREVAD